MAKYECNCFWLLIILLANIFQPLQAQLDTSEIIFEEKIVKIASNYSYLLFQGLSNPAEQAKLTKEKGIEDNSINHAFSHFP